jgi:phosphonate transport system substrate-binding protein
VSLQDSDFQTLDKVQEARICFADPDSASGYLYPAAYIQKTKNLPPQQLKSTFAGSHRACLKKLLAGKCDLVASWPGALRDARQSGLDVGDLTIVAKTGRIPYDAYCVPPDLDPTLTEKIRKTLLETNTLTKQGRRVLAPTLGINGWVPTKDQTYDEVRRIEDRLSPFLSGE